jgi:hypothetical protein
VEFEAILGTRAPPDFLDSTPNAARMADSESGRPRGREDDRTGDAERPGITVSVRVTWTLVGPVGFARAPTVQG